LQAKLIAKYQTCSANSGGFAPELPLGALLLDPTRGSASRPPSSPTDNLLDLPVSATSLQMLCLCRAIFR